MSKLIVSSALTFLDTTDHNQLSAYLTSNFATVQTCTSDREVYSPSWADTPLEIQLHTFYDGTEMTEQELIDKVTWYYKDGNKDQVEIENNNTDYNASVSKLKVLSNVLKNCESDTITFICKIELNEVDVMTVQMTYTLISDTKAVSFYLGMPGGDTFTNQQGEKKIIAYAHRGVEEIKAGTDEDAGKIDSDTAKFEWYKYEQGEWELDKDDIDDHDPKTLTIQGTSVLNVASFKCIMTYKGVEYIGVATVRDITDTYISEIFTIGGDVFKNGIGGSAAYVIVRKNNQANEEDDPLKCEISTTAGAAQEDDYWCQIDHEHDRVIYKQYKSGGWQEVAEIPQKYVYEWTLMDKNGNRKAFVSQTNTNDPYKKTGKVIYVSCYDIDDTGTVHCEVSTKD